MSEGTILSLILAGVAAALAGFAFWKAGKIPTSSAEVAAEIEKQLVEANAFVTKLAEAAKLASEGVAAAQQLWESGQIPEDPTGLKDARFLYVFSLLSQAFPSLTEAQLEMTVETAVYWFKQALNASQKKEANA